MSELLEIGAIMQWVFPGTSRVYPCMVTEQHPPQKKGDEERYRVAGENFNCFAFRKDLTRP